MIFLGITITLKGLTREQAKTEKFLNTIKLQTTAKQLK